MPHLDKIPRFLLRIDLSQLTDVKAGEEAAMLSSPEAVPKNLHQVSHDRTQA